MNNHKAWINILRLKNKGDDIKTEDINKIKGVSSFYFWTKDVINSDPSHYLICDYSESNSEFILDVYNKASNQIKEFFAPIMIFQNWEQERDVYWKALESANAKDKAQIRNIFEKMRAIYTDGDKNVTCFVADAGINYLEYPPTDMSFSRLEDIESVSLKGYIYSVSLSELFKLFNVTGKDLFLKNIRRGKVASRNDKDISKNFRDYLKAYIYSYLQRITDSDWFNENMELLQDILEIDAEILDTRKAENFWFNHNGITVFYYGDKGLERVGNQIKIPPQNVSVINGAQTLTNFFAEVEEIEKKLGKQLEELNISDSVQGLKNFDLNKNLIEPALQEAQKRILVKTIFVTGDEQHVESVTKGLNTQNPVDREDIIATEPNTKKLNEVLRNAGIKILRAGEISPYETGYRPLEFVKKYFMIKDRPQPGRSKNFLRKDLDQAINDAAKDFEGENRELLLAKLRAVSTIEEWWKISRNERSRHASNNSLYETIGKYGLNYFISYAFTRYIEDIDEMFTYLEDMDDTTLSLVYDFFLEDIERLEVEVTLDDFKNDHLFDALYGGVKEAIIDSETIQKKKLIDIDKEELKILSSQLLPILNDNIGKTYTLNKVITKFLQENNIEVPYFRVINLLDNKCKEHFPFPNSTFNELIDTMLIKEKYEDGKLVRDDVPDVFGVPYEHSAFKKEIAKEYPIFVINRKMKKNTEDIEKVTIYNGFSFENFEDEAENVYNLTVDAFYMGDENAFPKVSEHIFFHVRTKAMNSSDVFEFSNGEFLTKRSFWANKETVESILSDLADWEGMNYGI